tara:strand:- start:133 stop:444 length:312 start_codon:yes stop_codon:yes gene_type:complete
VVVLAVAWEEGLARALAYAEDTGFRELLAMDLSGVDANCWEMPAGEDSLYRYFNDRIALSGADSPFPFQVIIGPDRNLAYASRLHQPDRVLGVLGALISDSED